MSARSPRQVGLGIIPVYPPLYGRWPFGEVFPPVVELAGRTFELATWAWPFTRAVQQYREAVDYDSMHLFVYDDGSFEVWHKDSANPDRGHLLEHAVLDAPLLTSALCGAAGLVTGLLLGTWAARSGP